jgi:hypothetical protein
MNDRKVAFRTGIFGLLCLVFWLSQFPLYMMADTKSSFYDGAASARDLYKLRNIAFTRILLDQCLYIAMMLFTIGLRQLIKQARKEYEWAGTLLFGTVIVWLGVTLVADGLQGGAALDAVSGSADPSSVRALLEGTILIYNGSTAFVMTAFFLTVAGYATFATLMLPRWTGWVAYVAAGLCIACVPAMYFGPIDPLGFYNAGGWGPAIIANFPPAIWFIIASILLIRKRNIAHQDTALKTGFSLQGK